MEKEFTFIENTLETDLIGMNAGLLKQYIMFIADGKFYFILIYVFFSFVTWMWFGYAAIYNVKNPFPWMDKWSMEGITSFFEKRNPEYQQAGVLHEIKKRKRKDNEEDSDGKFHFFHFFKKLFEKMQKRKQKKL